MSWVNEIPIKITAIKKRELKLSGKQMASVFVVGPLGLLSVLLMLRTVEAIDNVWADVGVILVGIVSVFILLRIGLKLYFDEKQLYKDYLREKDSKVFNIGYWWDILSINEDTGMIMLQNKEFGGYDRALVVKLERTSIIGREPNYEDNHYSGYTQFIRKLLAKNYKIRNYNLSCNDTNEDKFAYIESHLETITNPSLKRMVESIIRYNKVAVRDIENRKVEYLEITSSGTNMPLLNDVKEAIAILEGYTIYKPVICKEKDLINFFLAFSKLEIINVRELLISKLPKEKVLKVENIIPKKSNSNMFKVTVTREDALLEEYYKMQELLNKERNKDNG